MSILITKASGEQVPFDPSKLRQSLHRAGASPRLIDEITGQIEGLLTPGMSTKKIYQKAFSLLKKMQRPAAARYKLKRAIMELGPSGYPFEHLVGEIMRDQGYQSRVGVMMEGKCISHEVDVLAESQEEKIMIECKYGNTHAKKVNSQVSMYVLSRFNDLASKWRKEDGGKERHYQGWIVTNTTFTEEAIRFGTCMGLRLVAWDYPHKGSLREMVDFCRLYPVTALTLLTKKEKEELLNRRIVLCRELRGKKKLLEEIQVSPNRMKKVLEEIEEICK